MPTAKSLITSTTSSVLLNKSSKASTTSTPAVIAVCANFALKVSSLSLKALSLSSLSCDKIIPLFSASSPSCFNASAPPNISGLRSCADFPKICIASASRSVSFATFPNALMVSVNTASLSRKPLASVIATFNVLKASAAVPVPSFALDIFFIIFAIEPVKVSIETSIISLAY